jgi:steroid delta-isomerase-like uncharacterized protein
VHQVAGSAADRPPLEEDMMSKLQDMLRTHYDAVNSGDLDAAVAVFDADVETQTPNGTMKGVEEFRAFGQVFQKAVPDNRMRVVRSFEVGDTIIVEGVYSGTQTGPLESPNGTIPPSGQAFSFPYVDVLTERDGLFVSHHIYWDNVTFLAQIGALPG